MSRTILIRGGGFSNKGAEAMMLTVQRQLGRRIGGLQCLATIPLKQSDLAYQKGILPVGREGRGLSKECFKSPSCPQRRGD